jgi:hypothetical protein
MCVGLILPFASQVWRQGEDATASPICNGVNGSHTADPSPVAQHLHISSSSPRAAYHALTPPSPPSSGKIRCLTISPAHASPTLQAHTSHNVSPPRNSAGRPLVRYYCPIPGNCFSVFLGCVVLPTSLRCGFCYFLVRACMRILRGDISQNARAPHVMRKRA